MDDDATLRAHDLRRWTLFQGFSDAELQLLAPHLSERAVAPGMTIVREGEPPAELFVIRKGRVEVTKQAAGSALEPQLTTLAAGDSFGEMALVDRVPRSASVRAREPTVVTLLPMARLESVTAGNPRLEGHLLRNLAADLARRLRATSETTAAALERELELARTRVAMGTFLTYILLVMCAYGFVLRAVVDLVHAAADTTLVSIPVILGFGAALFAMMWQSGRPLRDFGLTLRGGTHSAREALLWTVPLLVLTTLVKLVLVRLVRGHVGAPVFTLGSMASSTLVLSLAYAIVVPFQEIVARGAMQSSLARFYVGRRATARAIFVANALFTASHLYLSTTFAVVSFLPGLFWGVLYARHGTLVGPVLSHALLGWWVLFALGADRLLA
jgi:hypothetical protein